MPFDRIKPVLLPGGFDLKKETENRLVTKCFKRNGKSEIFKVGRSSFFRRRTLYPVTFDYDCS